jgi:hypothetical protein
MLRDSEIELVDIIIIIITFVWWIRSIFTNSQTGDDETMRRDVLE